MEVGVAGVLVGVGDWVYAYLGADGWSLGLPISLDNVQQLVDIVECPRIAPPLVQIPHNNHLLNPLMLGDTDIERGHQIVQQPLGYQIDFGSHRHRIPQQYIPGKLAIKVGFDKVEVTEVGEPIFGGVLVLVQFCKQGA